MVVSSVAVVVVVAANREVVSSATVDDAGFVSSFELEVPMIKKGYGIMTLSLGLSGSILFSVRGFSRLLLVRPPLVVFWGDVKDTVFVKKGTKSGTKREFS